MVSYNGTATSVIIPNVYNSKPVTEIESGGFSDCHALRSIVIPDSVTCVGDSAFDGCNIIQDVKMPAVAINYIPKSHLIKVEITSGDSLPNSAFANCTTLNTVILSDSITTMGYGAFEGCQNLSSIKLSNKLTSIPKKAFYGCTRLPCRFQYA